MYITVNDGTGIHVEEKGEGPPIIFLAGGGFSSKIFKSQIDYFSQSFQVIAVDMRAHGNSERVAHGLRLSRLAHDLKEVVDAMQLRRLTLLGHSLGSSVIYSFLDLFARERVERIILVDEAPVLTANPLWSKEEC